jgi:anti-sigma B factor antagonist
MNTLVRTTGQTRIVDLDGDVDLTSSPELRETLFEGLREAPRVALNLGTIRYIDSSGIAVLLETLREAQRLNRTFVLFGMNPSVHEVFKLTHVTRIFQIAETEEQALAIP